MKPTGRKLKTTESTFEMIEMLKEEDGAGVSEIADKLDKSPGTVHAYLATLKHSGYVIQEGDEYRLSLKFVDLGNYVLDSNRANVIADKYTEKVVNESGCRSIFGVEENGQGVYISRNSGEHSDWKHEQTGNRFSLHSTAAGKVLLAHQSPERIDAILDRWGMPAETENTITERDELDRELQTVRDEGVGFNDEESVPGVRAVGAPVFGPSSEIIGVLSANGPANQLVGDWFREELPDIVIGFANEFELDLTLKE